ncbi:MAG: hypothetical protein IJZ89_08640 [Clostridia bacterium]|nr:hypothetical protein [Clostridia bacterium]
MTIIEFTLANWDSILIIACFCLALGILYFMGQKRLVYKILYALVTEAEAKFGGGTGELKQAYVIKQIYNALPGILKSFISAERIGAWVDDALETAKEKWAKNGNITNYIENK